MTLQNGRNPRQSALARTRPFIPRRHLQGQTGLDEGLAAGVIDGVGGGETLVEASGDGDIEGAGMSDGSVSGVGIGLSQHCAPRRPLRMQSF